MMMTFRNALQTSLILIPGEPCDHEPRRYYSVIDLHQSPNMAISMPYEVLVNSMGGLRRWSLRQARLVCKDFPAASEPHMFRRIYISPLLKDMEAFYTLRTKKSSASPFARSYARTLCLLKCVSRIQNGIGAELHMNVRGSLVDAEYGQFHNLPWSVQGIQVAPRRKATCQRARLRYNCFVF